MNYGIKLLVLQNMIACGYLSKARWNPQNTSIKAHLQHGLTVKQNPKSPGTLCPCEYSLSSSLLLFPSFSGSFPHFCHVWELISWVLFFSVAMTAAGDTGIVPVRPYYSTLILVWIRGLPFFFFVLFCFPAKIKNMLTLFLSLQRRHILHVVSVCLLGNEMPNKSVLEHHLMGKVMYLLKTTFLAFSRKPDLQQWLGNLPKPHTNILFSDGLPGTLCSIDILLHF